MTPRQQHTNVQSGEYVIMVYGVSPKVSCRSFMTTLFDQLLQLPIRMTKETWQVVKDLYRKILSLEPDPISTTPGNVNIHAPCDGHKYPSASCTIKSEAAVTKLFSMLCLEYLLKETNPRNRMARRQLLVWLSADGMGLSLRYARRKLVI